MKNLTKNTSSTGEGYYPFVDKTDSTITINQGPGTFLGCLNQFCINAKINEQSESHDGFLWYNPNENATTSAGYIGFYFNKTNPNAPSRDDYRTSFIAASYDYLVVEAVSEENLSIYTGDTIKLYNSFMNPFIEVSIPINVSPGINFTIENLNWEIPSISQGTALFGYGYGSDQVLQNWETIKENYKGKVNVVFEYNQHPGLPIENSMRVRVVI